MDRIRKITSIVVVMVLCASGVGSTFFLIDKNNGSNIKEEYIDAKNTEKKYSGVDEPIKVNAQLDLVTTDDVKLLDKILEKIESFGWDTTIFVTPEIASNYAEVIQTVEKRGHSIGVLGTIDLKELDFNQQFTIISNELYLVRDTVLRPEHVVDYKSFRYTFNNDTLTVLQDLKFESFTARFPFNESYCKCWYAEKLGKITFPYPINSDFTLIPITSITTDEGEILFDDSYIISQNISAEEYLDYLTRTYDSSRDPLFIAIHPSITASDENLLKSFNTFCEHIYSKEGKIRALGPLYSRRNWIEDLKVKGPAVASPGEVITLNVTYRATKYCPHYRFHAYGKYRLKRPKLLDSWQHCYFVHVGTHSFKMYVKIPDPPFWDDTLTIRVVGRASFGGCAINDPGWPTYFCFGAGVEIEIKISTYFKAVPGYEDKNTLPRKKGRLNVVFVPDEDYKGNIQEFLLHVKDRISNYEKVSPISDNMNKFNFWYTEHQGNAEETRLVLPDNFWKHCAFRDAAVILHKKSFRDGALGDVFSAEGLTSQSENVFVHESGHALFDLSDEYMDTSSTCTSYRPTSLYPNIWSTKEEAEVALETYKNAGWDTSKAKVKLFCDPKDSNCCKQKWWKICKDQCIMLNGPLDEGFGVACQVRIDHVFNSLPHIPRTKTIKSICIWLEFEDSQLSVLGVEVVDSPPPNYIPGLDEILVKTYSMKNTVLDEIYISIPKWVFQDPSDCCQPAGNKNNTIFPVVVPYFFNAKNVSFYNQTSGEMMFSVDISGYTTGVINGTVLDYKGNPVENALIQLDGPSIGSAWTDENGSYALYDLEAGYYTVIVTPPPISNLMTGYAATTVSTGEISTVNFVLQPAGSIAGKITDKNGEPIQGYHLYLSGYETPRYETDENGEYAIGYLASNEYTVNIIEGADDWYISVNGKYVKKGYSVTVDVAVGETTFVNFTQKPPDWPMFHHDPQHTGFSPSEAPETATVKWTYQTYADVWSSPAIVYDGKLYIGSMDGKIYCLDAEDGRMIWNYATNGNVFSSPAVADGRVFVGSADTKVYCLDAEDGSMIWDYATEGSVFSSPAVIDGRVYIGSDKLYCLNAEDGIVLWRCTFVGDVLSSPAIASGRVFVGSTDGRMYCLDAEDGSTVWSYTTGGGVFSSPAVVDGKVFFGSTDEKVYCLNAENGREIWSYPTFGAVISSPAVVDDMVFVGSTDKRMYCLGTRDGHEIWSVVLGPISFSSPAVADGKVFVGSDDCYIYCLDLEDGSMIWKHLLRGSVFSSPAVFNGCVFVGSRDGRVYCFSDEPSAPLHPVADAGGPYSGLVGETITFDGTASIDKDGGSSIVRYDWQFTSGGPWYINIGPNPTYTYYSPGTYTVTLRVHDDEGVTDTDTATVEISSDAAEVVMEDLYIPFGGIASSYLKANYVADDVGSCLVTLSWDPTVVSVKSVGESDFEDFFYYLDNTAGTLRITAMNTNKVLTGDFNIARIEFAAVGSPGVYWGLTVQESQLLTADPQPSSIPHTRENATIYIQDNGNVPLPGDMDGNGALNGGDVRYLAMYLAGDPAYTPLYADGDVDSSGSVNAGDVRYLALYLAGDPAYTPLYP